MELTVVSALRYPQSGTIQIMDNVNTSTSTMLQLLQLIDAIPSPSIRFSLGHKQGSMIKLLQQLDSDAEHYDNSQLVASTNSTNTNSTGDDTSTPVEPDGSQPILSLPLTPNATLEGVNNPHFNPQKAIPLILLTVFNRRGRIIDVHTYTQVINSLLAPVALPPKPSDHYKVITRHTRHAPCAMLDHSFLRLTVACMILIDIAIPSACGAS
jgi:hypothetical protein